MLREWNRLQLRDNILYRARQIQGQTHYQLVLPKKYRSEALIGLHDHVGHPGVDRTLELVRSRYYWPGMSRDVDNKVHHCERCTRRKDPPQAHRRVPLVSVTTHTPMELVCMDYLSLEESKGGCSNILVITDHFTKYAVAIPTRNQTAVTTAKVLFDNFIVHYGFPKRLHSDQGRNFESRVVSQLCKLAGVAKSRTTPYHPMGNGVCERFNHTLLNMLGTLSDEKKVDWKAYVAPLVHAYNCTRHESTRYTPYYLVFGRHPRLAIDVYLGVEPEGEGGSLTEYVKKMEERLKYAYELASKEAIKAGARYKRNYDLKTRDSHLEPGDRVLVKRLAKQGKCKLADRWEKVPYIVKAQPMVRGRRGSYIET